MPKVTTREQHLWLHQRWDPPNCCLCNCETKIGNLERKIEQVRDEIESWKAVAKELRDKTANEALVVDTIWGC